jgi:hypothetical protein
VLCVQGDNVDCHRTWEALALGCGVVGEDLPFLRELLGELPGDIGPAEREATPPAAVPDSGDVQQSGYSEGVECSPSGGAGDLPGSSTASSAACAPFRQRVSPGTDRGDGSGGVSTILVSRSGCPAVFIDTYDRRAWKTGLTLDVLRSAYFDGRGSPVLRMAYWRDRLEAAKVAAEAGTMAE